jgi:hypothetical protein
MEWIITNEMTNHITSDNELYLQKKTKASKSKLYMNFIARKKKTIINTKIVYIFFHEKIQGKIQNQ